MRAHRQSEQGRHSTQFPRAPAAEAPLNADRDRDPCDARPADEPLSSRDTLNLVAQLNGPHSPQAAAQAQASVAAAAEQTSDGELARELGQLDALERKAMDDLHHAFSLVQHAPRL